MIYKLTITRLVSLHDFLIKIVF